MSGRSTTRLHVIEGLIPTVEVTDDVGFDYPERVVKTLRGFTIAHALNRAVRWVEKHR